MASEFMQKTKNFLMECKRVLIVTKKPDKAEFLTVFRVSGLGILLIGVIGFIIQMVVMVLK